MGHALGAALQDGGVHRLVGGGVASADEGDLVDFASVTSGLLINAADNDFVLVRAEDSPTAKGLWLKSPEWIIGSEADDRIYAGEDMRGAEGGTGNDLIDGRLVAAFSELSPNGFDIELIGGAGNDTLVSGTGRSSAKGGDGADIFILSAMTTSASNRFSSFSAAVARSSTGTFTAAANSSRPTALKLSHTQPGAMGGLTVAGNSRLSVARFFRKPVCPTLTRSSTALSAGFSPAWPGRRASHCCASWSASARAASPPAPSRWRSQSNPCSAASAVWPVATSKIESSRASMTCSSSA